MKKTLLVFLALLAVMLVFTACGEETEKGEEKCKRCKHSLKITEEL